MPNKQAFNDLIDEVSKLHPQLDFSKAVDCMVPIGKQNRTARYIDNIFCTIDGGPFGMLAQSLKIGCTCKKCGIRKFSKAISIRQKGKPSARKFTHEKFSKDIEEKTNGTVSVFTIYQGMEHPIALWCIYHGLLLYESAAGAYYGEFCCGPCSYRYRHGLSVSKGEQAIYDHLDSLNIPYSPEQRFMHCRGECDNCLPFDVFLTDHKLLIEYDGPHHYGPIEFYGGEERFETIQKNDKIKTEWAAKNNIPLLRIPYWDFENIQLLIDQFISQSTS